MTIIEMLASGRCQLLPSVARRFLKHPAITSSQNNRCKLFYPVSYCPCSIIQNRDYKKLYKQNVGGFALAKPVEKSLNDRLVPSYNNHEILPHKRHVSLASTIVNGSSLSIQPYMKLMRIDKPIGNSIAR